MIPRPRRSTSPASASAAPTRPRSPVPATGKAAPRKPPAAPRSATRAVEKLEIVRAVQLLYALDEREIAIPIFADLGEDGDPDALVGLGELASRNSDARGMLLLGKAALNRGLPFDFYAYPVTGIPPFRSIGPEVEQSIMFAIARQESAFNPF